MGEKRPPHRNERTGTIVSHCMMTKKVTWVKNARASVRFLSTDNPTSCMYHE